MPKRKRSAVGPDCGDIFTRYQFVCSGDYPAEFAYKYGALTVSEGDKFSVFRLTKPKNLLLIVFQTDELDDCNILELLNPTTIKCSPSSGRENKIVRFPSSRIDCINHSFIFADELVSDCTVEQIPENKLAVLYYAEPKTHDSLNFSVGAINSHTSFIWIIVVVIMLLFIFR